MFFERSEIFEKKKKKKFVRNFGNAAVESKVPFRFLII